MEPTKAAYSELLRAYDFLNRRLFSNTLPPCMLTLQRKNARVLGFVAPGIFVSEGQRADELAMNPIHFVAKNTKDVLSTLAHEQAHVWQIHFGKPGRRGYHNKEWAAKMKEIGLQPSNTGMRGGKETGEKMDHYIVTNGPFDRAAEELLKNGFRFSWAEGDAAAAGKEKEDGEGEEKEDKSNRRKYVCESCEITKVWGKPRLSLVCKPCGRDLIDEKAEQTQESETIADG